MKRLAYASRPRRILALSLAASLLLPLGSAAFAQNISEPVYAYGESLTAQEKLHTAQLLKVDDQSLEIQVNIKEMNGLLHDSYNYYQVYSSVYLDPEESGKGVSVEIVTPETITHITPTQYANAAITAGATDMKIRVASVKAVDGSGALAGVYKAFSGTTGALPEENIKAAQKELEVTAKINEDNQGKEGYSDDLLNAAVAEMKAQISSAKNENNGTLNGDQITNIINSVINNYNLNGILSSADTESLKGLMEQFSNLKLSDEQVDNLKALGQKLLSSGGDLMKKVNAQWNQLSPETKSEVSGFFSNLFRAIGDFFASLFNN